MLQSEDVLASAFQKHVGEYASGITAWSVVAQALLPLRKQVKFALMKMDSVISFALMLEPV